MYKNSKLDQLFTLSHKLTLYIPSTMDVDKPIDNAEFVDKTASIMAEYFGGATSTKAIGFWISEQNQTVKENTTLIFSYCTSNQLDNSLSKIIEHCEYLKNAMKQEAIAFELDGQMYFI